MIEATVKTVLIVLPWLLGACFLIWAVRRIDWKLVCNRSLHWIAAVGLFCLLNQLGIQQFATDYVASLSWTVSQKG